ncbi:MAG: hypothetical protein RL757_641 [Bacteroidota bacterium]|jgi:hypothetical protein
MIKNFKKIKFLVIYTGGGYFIKKNLSFSKKIILFLKKSKS